MDSLQPIGEYERGMAHGFVCAAKMMDDAGQETLAFQILGAAGIVHFPLNLFDEQDHSLLIRWSCERKRLERSRAKHRKNS